MSHMQPDPASNAESKNPHSLSEELDLVTRIAGRDRIAMKRLYLIYHKRLSRFLLRIVHRQDLVEEIINDTMFAVWVKAADFRGDSRASTWILGIAYRQALKSLRHQRSRGPHQSMSDLPDIDEPNHDAGAEQRELHQWLDQALAKLPAVQRMVIELAYFLGHSCEEIAMITDSPVNTVKTRMFHARERLRQLLGGFDSVDALQPARSSPPS